MRARRQTFQGCQTLQFRAPLNHCTEVRHACHRSSRNSRRRASKGSSTLLYCRPFTMNSFRRTRDPRDTRHFLQGLFQTFSENPDWKMTGGLSFVVSDLQRGHQPRAPAEHKTLHRSVYADSCLRTSRTRGWTRPARPCRHCSSLFPSSLTTLIFVCSDFALSNVGSILPSFRPSPGPSCLVGLPQTSSRRCSGAKASARHRPEQRTWHPAGHRAESAQDGVSEGCRQEERKEKEKKEC